VSTPNPHPRALLARTLGAEDSYICICLYKRSWWAEGRNFWYKLRKQTSDCTHTLQWRKQLLRIFGPELIRINWLINSLIKTARSAVSKNRAERGFLFAASAAKFWKHDISSASERAFPGFFCDFFGCSTLSKKRYFSTQEFTRFLSTVSSQRRTTRSNVSFQT